MLRTVCIAPLLMVLAVSGCTAGSPPAEPRPASPSAAPSSAGSSAPVPRAVAPPAPRLAACYRLTRQQLPRPSNASAAVSCSRSHTARTIFVGTLDTVVDGHAVAVDGTTVKRQLASTCPRELAEHVGGTSTKRQLSRFNVVWFSPTLEQADRGADWFRCDLVAVAGPGDRLLELRGRRLRGVLDRDGALDAYGLCGTAPPGARGFDRVICSRRHAWRAVDTIGLARGRGYPAAAVRAAGEGRCKDVARARSANTLRFRYGWEWPTREQWDRGQRYGYCWVPD